MLGSATPSLESWSNAEKGRYARVVMLTRVMDRPLPKVELVDMRAEFQAVGKEEIFSRRLVEEVQGHHRSRRAGNCAAEPARLLFRRDVPLAAARRSSARTAPSR